MQTALELLESADDWDARDPIEAKMFRDLCGEAVTAAVAEGLFTRDEAADMTALVFSPVRRSIPDLLSYLAECKARRKCSQSTAPSSRSAFLRELENPASTLSPMI